MCECGGVGCGKPIELDHAPRYRSRRIPQKLCTTCRTRFCGAHYDSDGVNIPAPSCPARLKYNLARAFAKSA